MTTVQQCLTAACQHYGVSDIDICSDRRQAHLVKARHVAFWLAKQTTLASYPKIGRAFGDRHHTTILHGVNKIEARRTESQEFRRETNLLRSRAAADHLYAEWAQQGVSYG